MIEVIFYFDADKSTKVDEIIERICNFEKEFRPVYFTASEGRKNKKDVISDADRFLKFRSNNPLGFFLMAPIGEYNFSFKLRSKIQHFTINLFCNDDKVSFNVLKRLVILMCDYEPFFGYVCDYEEVRNRNKVKVVFGGQSLETFVGLNFWKYIPGLYWITFFSKEFLKRFGADPHKIESISEESCLLGSDESVYFFKFYEKISDWKKNKSKLDSILNSENYFFKKNKLEEELKSARTIMEASSICAKWQ